jgi:hypothetical protein
MKENNEREQYKIPMREQYKIPMREQYNITMRENNTKYQ